MRIFLGCMLIINCMLAGALLSRPDWWYLLPSFVGGFCFSFYDEYFKKEILEATRKDRE